MTRSLGLRGVAVTSTTDAILVLRQHLERYGEMFNGFVETYGELVFSPETRKKDTPEKAQAMYVS